MLQVHKTTRYLVVVHCGVPSYI